MPDIVEEVAATIAAACDAMLREVHGKPLRSPATMPPQSANEVARAILAITRNSRGPAPAVKNEITDAHGQMMRMVVGIMTARAGGHLIISPGELQNLLMTAAELDCEFQGDGSLDLRLRETTAPTGALLT